MIASRFVCVVVAVIITLGYFMLSPFDFDPDVCTMEKLNLTNATFEWNSTTFTFKENNPKWYDILDSTGSVISMNGLITNNATEPESCTFEDISTDAFPGGVGWIPYSVNMNFSKFEPIAVTQITFQNIWNSTADTVIFTPVN